MILLDAYAVLAYLRDEAAAGEVAAMLRAPTVLTAVNAAEVVDQLVRIHGWDADEVHGDLVLLVRAGMQIDTVSAEVGVLAGRLRSRHYHRATCAVSLADCTAAASALASGRALATADPALADMVRRENGAVHGLPDSGGRRP